MRTFKILRKRDGQNWEKFGEIYTVNFDAAKKEFAKRMTEDNWNKSNNINWLTKEDDGVEEDGWYDVSTDDCELFCSKTEIESGFESFTEDVYMYKLQNSFKMLVNGEVEEEAFADDENEAIAEMMEFYDTTDVKLI